MLTLKVTAGYIASQSYFNTMNISKKYIYKYQKVIQYKRISPNTLPLRICTHSWISVLFWWRGLCNSMKGWAMPCRATEDGQVIVASSDKMRSTGGGNGKPVQITCRDNPLNCIKKAKNMWHRKMSPPDQKVGPICNWGRMKGNY